MSFDIDGFGKLIKYYPEELETDIVIPDEVKIIGSGTFAGNENLKSVVIPEGVVEIENSAFRACENLLYIDIPDSVVKIGYEAFRDCEMMERVKLPHTLKFLDNGAFRECSSLSEITIPDEITKIKKRTFFHCISLAHITLPKNLTEIEYRAFIGCNSLKTIEIPEGVTLIGEDAFSLSGLSRAVIPRSIKTIDDGAFINTDNLVTNIPVSDWQDDWGITRVRYALNFMNSYTAGDHFFDDVKEENNQAIKDLLYDIELEFSPENDIKALWYLIKEELLEVEDIEFFSEKLMDDAEITAMLLDYKNTHFSAEYVEKWEQDKIDKALGNKEYTYRDWSRIFKLEKEYGEYVIEKYRGSDDMVDIPGEIEGVPVTAILPRAFDGLDKLNSVFIEEGVTHIAAEVFIGCSLTEITLPETLRGIGLSAFSGCINLTEITIPSEVTDISEQAFCNCSSLERVVLPDKITDIKRGTFFGTAISEIVIPEGVKAIEEHAFANCDSLSKIILPHSLKIIEKFAFVNCHSLKRIVLYDNLCSITHTAFADITGLTIVAPTGSFAMDFAFEMGYKFEPLEQENRE